MSAPAQLRLLARYGRLRRILLWSFVARIPLGAVTLSLFLGTRISTGSLEFAGWVSSAAVVGMAAGAPVQGRLLDAFPLPRVVAGFAAGQVLALAALAPAVTGDRRDWVVVALAFVQGASVPALSSCTRLVTKRSLPPEELGTAFALDSVLLEVVYLGGPALAAWAVTAVGVRPVLVAAALLTAVGTVQFLRAAGLPALTGTADDAPVGPGPESTDQPAPAAPGLFTAGSFVLGMALLAAPFGLIEVALTQRATEEGATLASVGTYLTIMGVGSVIGGLVHGALRWRGGVSVRFVLLALGLGAGLASVAVVSGPAPVGLAFALAGLCVAPLAALGFQILDLISPPGAWMQLQGWGSVANTAGHAVGLTVGGYVAAAQGSSAAFGLIAVAVPLAVALSLPALRTPARSRPAATVGAA
ncbi:MFS transporter [Kitasatospora sp. NBC_00070]|uniref:MFS transporter n=1 Tax=Kitasatospora sp. NBC_00070 TaxID=2975962 RepID=UPI0032491E84